MNSQTQTLYVLVIGSRGVGKTRLLDRLMLKPFTDIYNPSQNNSSLSYTLDLEGNSFKLNITEMNKVPFKLFESSAIPQFDYIIFVYDLSKISTWHNLKKYKEQIQKYLDQNSLARCIIIGNKADKDDLVNIAKLDFFATHIEISAKQETLDEKEACMKIWNNASLLKPKVFQPPLKPAQNYTETSFHTSIPTGITKIQGSFDPAALIKTIIIGPECVGKTQFLYSITNEPFYEDYQPTIGVDFRVLNIGFQGKKYRVQFWDTAGQERFRSISTVYFKSGSLYFLVYDIASLNSFKQVNSFYETLAQNSCSLDQNFHAVLIGNKSDLQDQRQISYQEGQALAKKLNMKFYEISVMKRHGSMEALLTTLEEYLTSKKLI